MAFSNIFASFVSRTILGIKLKTAFRQRRDSLTGRLGIWTLKETVGVDQILAEQSAWEIIIALQKRYFNELTPVGSCY